MKHFEITEEKKQLGLSKLDVQCDTFRYDILTKPKQDIYEAAWKIVFVGEVYNCIMNEDDEAIDEFLCWFADSKADFEVLYQLFLKNESASVNTYKDTIAFFKYVLEEIQ